jgi:hypothetical protein
MNFEFHLKGDIHAKVIELIFCKAGWELRQWKIDLWSQGGQVGVILVF